MLYFDQTHNLNRAKELSREAKKLIGWFANDNADVNYKVLFTN